MGSNTEKKPRTNVKNNTKNVAKILRVTSFAILKLEEHYRKQ